MRGSEKHELRPRRLRPDNFTPPSRTPWGGSRIGTDYKSELSLPTAPGVIGESWEVSVEPSFPSVTEEGEELSQIIARAPEAWLGLNVATNNDRQLPLLVKLLDAADNLSVQVHPADDDEALGPDESGKPEAWVVLRAAAGAGLFLGFRDGVNRQEVERCLGANGPLDQLMNFVPVGPGDVFVIEAGTPHAIGRGVTLLEPQRVQPGRTGMTYRFWDWNRRYDASGGFSPDGKPRSLHVARSLAVTSWDAPRGNDLVASCRRTGESISAGPLARRRLVDWDHFVVDQWRGTGEARIEGGPSLSALTCVAGQAAIETTLGSLLLGRGQSAVIAAASGHWTVRARTAHVFCVQPR